MSHLILEAMKVYRQKTGSTEIPKRGSKDYTIFRNCYDEIKKVMPPNVSETKASPPKMKNTMRVPERSIALQAIDQLRLKNLVATPLPRMPIGNMQIKRIVPAESRM